MLYDHLGRPVATKPLSKELAAPSLAGVRTVWTDSVAAGLTPVKLAGLLRGAADGDHIDYLTLAEEMEERDLHYRGEMGKRKLAVSSLPVTVEAASDEPEDVRLADEVRALVKQAGFRSLLKDLLDALGKGYSVCEIMWQRGATWRPSRFEWRDPRWFTFDRATRRQLKLLDEADMAEGIDLTPYKFICHLPHLKTGLPVRGGLARVAAWAWMCKNYTIKDWMTFAELFGMPLRIGKYQPGADKEDIAVLKMAVANLGSDAAAVIPDSMLIEFQESTRASGGHELFERLADWLDRQVSRGILGQSATTEGTPGKLGNEEAQSEVREDIRDDDAIQLAETLNRDLVRPFIDLNWGAREQYPELVLRAIEEEDTRLLIDALKELVPLGLRVEQSVIRDKLGLPDPPEGAVCLGAPPSNQAETAMETKEEPVATAANSMSAAPRFTPEQQALEDLADTALAGIDLSGNEELIIAAVESADSYEQAMENLVALYPRLDLDGLQEMMERSMVAAEMFGRLQGGIDAGEG